ncbi:fructose-6-phosphate aldolase [Clostridium sporogenes]|jgi:fructose-6-phosphate aldolase 2|uniref:Fructose-6-phosphate aldolase n=3 Tax=Clostridium TaxID=1485 RepID=A0AAE4Z2Q3_CLOSG|nr:MULTISPECIES: fructose-6-phosphate aldolase [Clostridium]MBE6078486.1 fructose-6-phosphate aldolase [Clostridium lundense]AVQ38277.1 fructose-6-phosphate aldolase [Clostridium botulinum]EDU39106.1 putative fructose-6-phosphate aldolase [Clostridium sporogenes ATCC 15579]EKS4344527.1 fructose-6-phosphate aldolase [Clostridium botulinum]EKS4395000.1 fructose-6-phosphate aldolase [Clostridium botulinum]
MLIFLDTANIDSIKHINDIYPLDGVTTNPTIISKEKKDFICILKEIRNIIGKEKMLHVQVVGSKTEEMIEEAIYLNEKIGGNLYIKIPVTEQGIKAMKELSKKGYKITATAIFTAQQALMAAKAGAEFVAPYVNRIDNLMADGIKVVSDIVSIFEIYNINSKVLAASFKNTEQIHNACLKGAHSVTVNEDLIKQLIYHPSTDLSVDNFIKDWEMQYGKNTKTNEV